MYVKWYIWIINTEHQEIMALSWFFKLHTYVQIKPTIDLSTVHCNNRITLSELYKNCNQQKVQCADHWTA